MAEAPRILLEHHLKRLKLPTFLREYEKLARQWRSRAWIMCSSSPDWWSWS